jgi:hypothetical protein
MSTRSHRRPALTVQATLVVRPPGTSRYALPRPPSPAQMRRSGAITTARRLDVLAQMICAHVRARSAYSESARDREIWAARRRLTGTPMYGCGSTRISPVRLQEPAESLAKRRLTPWAYIHPPGGQQGADPV